MMIAFFEKYPDKGYKLSLTSSSLFDHVMSARLFLTLNFPALSEMCSKSKLRRFGVQEKIFDNPRFSFV